MEHFIKEMERETKEITQLLHLIIFLYFPSPFHFPPQIHDRNTTVYTAVNDRLGTCMSNNANLEMEFVQQLHLFGLSLNRPSLVMTCE